MNQFLKKIFLFLISGLILTCLVISISIYYFPEKFLGNSGEYYMWAFQSNKINNTKNKHLNLIIGDSRAMSGINPIIISSKYINMSIGGATFFEGFQTLKRLILNKNKIDTLIICYSQYHYELSDVFEERTLPFKFINNGELNGLISVEKQTNSKINDKSIGEPSVMLNVNRKLLFYRSPIVYWNTYLDNLMWNTVTPEIQKMIQSLSVNKGHTFFGQSDSATAPAIEASMDNFIPNPVLAKYLDSIVFIAKKQRVKILITTPPISQLTYNSCNVDYIKDFDMYLKSLNNKYHFTILNYTTAYPNSYFGDPSHLNKKGCDKFSRELRSIVFKD